MKAHVSAIINATSLPCMLYNNPVSYGTDFLPEHIQELANEHPNLQAVKKSVADAHRVIAIRGPIRDRRAPFVLRSDPVVLGEIGGSGGGLIGTAHAFPHSVGGPFN